MVYYAIVSGNTACICEDVKSAMNFIKQQKCPIYKTFFNKKEAELFCQQMTNVTRPISPINKDRSFRTNKVPIKGKTVAYIYYEFYKTKYWYSYTYQIPGHDWEIGVGSINILDINTAKISCEIEAIKEVLGHTKEITDLTIYVKNIRLVSLWIKNLQTWIQADWKVKATSELPLIKSLWEESKGRNLTIRIPPSTSSSKLSNLKSFIRDHCN